MKKIMITSTLLLFNFCFAGNGMYLDFSFNKFAVGYQMDKKILEIQPKISIGISNQDINTSYDDYYVNLGLKRGLFKFKNSAIYGDINCGYYFARNVHHNVNVLYAGTNIGYEYNWRRYFLFTETGYLFGKKQFKQHYKNNLFTASSIEELELSPFNFVIGFGINF